jgi:hypothetical protein
LLERALSLSRTHVLLPLILPHLPHPPRLLHPSCQNIFSAEPSPSTANGLLFALPKAFPSSSLTHKVLRHELSPSVGDLVHHYHRYYLLLQLVLVLPPPPPLFTPSTTITTYCPLIHSLPKRRNSFASSNEPRRMNAPLSSPTLGGPAQSQQRCYFSSVSSSSTASMASQGSGPTSAPQVQPKAQQAQSAAPAQRPAMDTTTSFRRDFNLVAEAAKRAQLAVLMRDFESVGLSG